MADLNKFQRSKEKLTEILYFLMTKNNADEQTGSYIMIIEKSIKTLDNKMKEFRGRDQRPEISD